MKKILLVFSLVLASQFAFSQGRPNAFQLSGGPSWHGTGDLGGLAFGVSYDHPFSKRTDVSTSITTTVHWGKDNGANDTGFGFTPGENLLHFTTAGIQLAVLGYFTPVIFRNSKLKIGAGPLLRFQTTNLPDSYGFHQNTAIYPVPFYTINTTQNYNTLAPGYNVTIAYLLQSFPRYSAGIKVSFQNDTNGDIITGISLIISKLLPGDSRMRREQ